MVIVVDGTRRALVARRVGAWRRLEARLISYRLDRQLAEGALPETSVLHAVHAARIVGPRSCRKLAGSVRGIIAAADAPPPRPAGVAVCRRNVRAASTEFDLLVERLERRGPINARGVARLRLLLSDGAGPIFGRGTPHDLRSRLGTILLQV